MTVRQIFVFGSVLVFLLGAVRLSAEEPIPVEEPTLESPEIGQTPAGDETDSPEELEQPAVGDEDPAAVEPIPGAPDLDDSAVGRAVIAGEVSDSVKLDSLAGVLVEVTGTPFRSETDANGKFRLEDLPAGEHTLEAFKLGYYNEVIVITAIEGQPVELRIALREKTDATADGVFELEEEVIIGEYNESSEGDLFLDIDLGSNLAAGLDKAQFTRLGISDAAGAVSKIAGANIVGGKYAVVRGLGDRYSNTLFNGALVPSADPSKKAVQLDLFPSDLLQSVAIIKTGSPDLPAEFAGGMVTIQALRIPEERLVEFKFGIQTNSNLDGDFLAAPEGDLGYWGDTSAKVPTKSISEGGLNSGHSGSRPPETPEEIAAASAGAADMAALHNSGGMRPKKRDPRPEYSMGFTLGDVYDITPYTRIGGVFSFTHAQGDQILTYANGRNPNFGIDQIPGGDGINEDFLVRSQSNTLFSEYVNWGALGSLGIEHGEDHKLGFTWFKNRTTEQNVIQGRQIEDVFDEFPEYLPASRSPFGAGAYTYQAFDQISQVQRDLEIVQGDGSHRIGTDDYHVTLDWLVSRGEALEDRPQTRSLFYSQLDFADPRIVSEQGDTYRPELGTVFTAGDVYDNNPPLVNSFRESLSTYETAANDRVDLTAILWEPEEGRKFELKMGLNSFSRDREVRGRFFEYKVSPVLNSNLLGENGANGVDYLNGFDSSTLPDGSPRFDGWTGPQANSQSGSLILTESTLLGRTVRNVDAGNEIDASYLMGTFDFDGWELRGGVRHEDESRYYQVLPGLNAPAFVNPDPVIIDNDYLLPSVSLSYTFGYEEEFRVTAAWFQSVARPTFYEFAPVQIQDQATGDVVVGNPALVDTEIDNFDIEFAWDPTVDTRLVMGLFRKDMKAPIAQAFDGFFRTWVNGEAGEIQGIELTGSHNLGAGWDIAANYTFIDSTLTYVQQLNTQGDTELIDSSFEGQPEHILNILVGYTHEPWQARASLVYNYTGSYLTGVPPTADAAAVIRESYHSLDLVISKDFQFNHCDGTVKLKMVNLLDSEDTQVFEGTSLPFNSFSPGLGVSLSADFYF